jgi:bacterioferritin
VHVAWRAPEVWLPSTAGSQRLMTTTPGVGILSPAFDERREQVVALLQTAYWMEIESVMSYIAASTNVEGLRAQEIKESLGDDIEDELGHAQRFAARIKELYGVVPGSMAFRADQAFLQPTPNPLDLLSVIRGVIDAETGAIEHYNRIIEETDGIDWVTQDMVIEVLHDEEGHRRLFEGFLRDCERET